MFELDDEWKIFLKISHERILLMFLTVTWRDGEFSAEKISLITKNV